MNELQALVFDVDGTLADTERDGHRVAFNQAFAAAGLDWEWSVPLYGELLAVTGGKERIRLYIDRYHPDFEFPGDPAAYIADLHRRKTEFYLALLKSGGIPLRAGVRRLLQEAREAGYVLAIATTTTPANVTGLLESTLGAESLDWFATIAAGDVVPNKKPAPDIYHYALEQLGLRAENCLAFEDSGNGVASSVDAGLRTVVTINDYTHDHDFSRAELVLDQLGEPDAPCKVLKGEVDVTPCLDVPAIERLWRGS